MTNDSFDYASRPCASSLSHPKYHRPQVMGLILALNAMVVGIQVDLVSREVSRWA